MCEERTTTTTTNNNIEKIHMIKMEFPLLEECLPAYSFVDIDIIIPVCTTVF